jgi:hypothetical protein
MKNLPLSSPVFVSGRSPGHYSVTDRGFTIVNGPQSYNRPLYGALNPNGAERFRIIAGDKPRLILDLPGIGGYVRFGFGSGTFFRFAENLQTVIASYDGGMTYVCRDPILGTKDLEIRIFPLRDEIGMIIRISAGKINPCLPFHIFFGGADGARDSRGFDAGYTPEAKIGFQASRCKNNQFLIGDRSCLLLTDRDTLPNILLQITASCLINPAGVAWLETGTPEASADPGNDHAIIRLTVPALDHNCETYLLLRPGNAAVLPVAALPREAAKDIFARTQATWLAIAGQASVDTPEPLLNAAVRVAGIALDAAWIPPFFVHGAWSWNIPLLGWRVRYGPITMGWHDRVVREAGVYLGMQHDENKQTAMPDSEQSLAAITAVLDQDYFGNEQQSREETLLWRPDPDPVYDLARQSSRSIFVSPGMIPYMPGKPFAAMYNMQEVFMDQLIAECRWTGDPDFIKMVFPALQRHIAWENRCFDADNDGLFENYANFWASDGVFAAGAGCLLASAYNYRANLAAYEFSLFLNSADESYRIRAERIQAAVRSRLWLAASGHPAECVDTWGAGLVHESVSLPSLVHAAESGIFDEFELYQALQYTETTLERLTVEGGELIWNTNWVPYRWSVRDIDYADVLHAALAYFRLGQSAEAWKLLYGALQDSTCHNIAPGSFHCVREGKSTDFTDTSSMFMRVVAEGLFGILPDLHRGEVTISPALPQEWPNAGIRTADFACSWQFIGGRETLSLTSVHCCRKKIKLRARMNQILSVRVDGQAFPYRIEPGIGHALVCIDTPANRQLELEICYSGSEPALPAVRTVIAAGRPMFIDAGEAAITGIYDPQSAVAAIEYHSSTCRIIPETSARQHTFFLDIRDGQLRYWTPVDLNILAPAPDLADPEDGGPKLAANRPDMAAAVQIDLQPYFRHKVADIFLQDYLSPRSPFCSLQVPRHLYPPNWCAIDRSAVAGLNDRLLRSQVSNGQFMAGTVPFRQIAEASANNVAFISRWDNYPGQLKIPIGQRGQLPLSSADWIHPSDAVPCRECRDHPAVCQWGDPDRALDPPG